MKNFFKGVISVTLILPLINEFITLINYLNQYFCVSLTSKINKMQEEFSKEEEILVKGFQPDNKLKKEGE